MIEVFLMRLKELGWTISSLKDDWICAIDKDSCHGLFFTYFKNSLTNPTKETLPKVLRWDAIIFCPEGVNSSNLKDSTLQEIQAWYIDLKSSEVFPYPPTKNHTIIDWLFKVIHETEEVKTLEAYCKPEKTRKFPYVSYIFIGLNLMVFLAMFFIQILVDREVFFEFTSDLLILFGAKHNTLINEGEIWRFLTSAFIHTGLLHLAFNVYALWALGSFAEELFGHRRFALIYLVSGVFGNVSSYIFVEAVSAGASGAIFGILGSLLFFSIQKPALWRSGLGKNLIIIILINLGFGFMVPQIDNYAHIGGLVAGFISSIIILRK